MTNEQTAVEWIAERFRQYQKEGYRSTWDEIIQTVLLAKQIEDQELAKERERAAMLVDMLLMILEGYLNPEYDRIMINKIIQTISEYRNQPETTGNQTAC